MKKTVNVNVGGYSFIIEEVAYEQLNMYLNNVRRNLGNDVDANEVMNDIESRIAELFREALRESGREVVETSLIDRVISVMGKPEDYGDGTENTQEQYQQATYNEPTPRALFRDPDNKMLGGVAAGLANYFGWDPLAIRIIFVLLLFGFGVGLPVYIVLWILVPEAKTTADKLRMRGQPVNVDTIKKRFNDFKNDVSGLGSKENQRRVKDTAHSIGSRIESVFRDFGKIVSRLLGTFLLLLGIVLLAFIIKYMITGAVSVPQTAAEELFFDHSELFFDSPFEYYCFTAGIFVLVTLIMLGLITSGIDLLFRVRIKSKPVKYAAVTFSIVAVTAIVYGGIGMGKNYAHERTIVNRYEIPMNDSLLNVTVLQDEYFNSKMSSYTNEDELIKVLPGEVVFGYPSLYIRRSVTGLAYMVVQKNASGARELKAIENAEAIEYLSQVDTSAVVLNPVFTSPAKNKFRNQDVNVTLFLPDHTTIKNLSSLRRMLRIYDSAIVLTDDNIIDEPYVMTQNGMMSMSEYTSWQKKLTEEKEKNNNKG